MATPLNTKRIVVGGLLGGLCWNVWSIIMNVVLLGKLYAAGQAEGHLLGLPRYRFFIGLWIITLLLVGMGLAWVYAAARNTLGPGPGTAFKIGLVIGLISSWPGNLAQASWSPLSRMLPLGWMLDSLIGTIIATLVAGWYYRER